MNIRNGLAEDKWKGLIKHIRRGTCTPFIGAGACANLPKGSDLARMLAKEYNYPLDDTYDLQRVSQFVAINVDLSTLRADLIEELKKGGYPDLCAKNETHSVLADLNLPIYVTTNYDDFMVQALRKRERDVQVDFARWANEISVSGIKSVLCEEGYEPSPEKPVVFHLHGNWDYPDSIVLTEEDYLDFVINISKKKELIPPAIIEAFSRTALLFIGYSLNDWTLRFILRGLMSTRTAINNCRSIAVQLEPTIKNEDALEAACKYLDDYFDRHFQLQIDVYWGKAEEFALELRDRIGKPVKETAHASV
jgi:hypothetical protein